MKQPRLLERYPRREGLAGPNTSRALVAFWLSLALLALPSTSLGDDVELQLSAGDGFVLKDNSGTIERLRVHEDTGNISRNGALFVHTTGTNNTFVGAGAAGAAAGTSNNSAFGKDALGSGNFGDNNSAFGNAALRQNEGSSNSAFGDSALSSNISGQNNSAFGSGAMTSSTLGSNNSAFGRNALRNNLSGSNNSGFGVNALRENFTSSDNSAFGNEALRWSSDGSRNSAFGDHALYQNYQGEENVALGADALRNNRYGSQNAALGHSALLNLNPAYGIGSDRNVALGRNAGSTLTTGDDNIYIANLGGVTSESGKIKIGNSAHTEAFIEGIDGNVASGGLAVLVNSSNELHVIVSSARFKEDVQDMGADSRVLMQLRPVAFRYRDHASNGDDGPDEYGLIAEEVAELAPELIVRNAEGEPHSVRYHVLPAMLLNEIQRQRRTLATLDDGLKKAEAELARIGQGANR